MEVAADIKQDPVGLLGTKASVFSVSCLEEIGFIQPPGPSLSSRDRFKWLLISGRSGCRGKGEEIKKKWCSPGTGSWFPLKGYT